REGSQLARKSADRSHRAHERRLPAIPAEPRAAAVPSCSRYREQCPPEPSPTALDPEDQGTGGHRTSLPLVSEGFWGTHGERCNPDRSASAAAGTCLNPTFPSKCL